MAKIQQHVAIDGATGVNAALNWVGPPRQIELPIARLSPEQHEALSKGAEIRLPLGRLFNADQVLIWMADGRPQEDAGLRLRLLEGGPDRQPLMMGLDKDQIEKLKEHNLIVKLPSTVSTSRIVLHKV